MKLKRYTSAGLVIESAFDLPGLYTAEAAAGPAQLRYLYSKNVDMDFALLSNGLCWSDDRKSVRFFAPDIAVFDISAVGVVSVSPLSTNLDDIAAYLVGSVLGIALHMRKIVTIHASAVKVGDAAILFCGESGAGKSTMAAALQQRGYPVLSDDLCALDISRSGAIVHSDGRKLKLWSEAIGKFGLHGLKGQPVQQGYEKYFVDGDSACVGRAPVHAIYELITVRETVVPKVIRVSGAEAATLVRRNAYRPFLVSELKDEALYFEAATSLLRNSSVYRLERAHRFDQLDLLIDALRKHW